MEHGTKAMTIKNKVTGKVEHIRSDFKWSNKKKAIKRIKEDWEDSDFKVLSVRLV